MELKAEFTTEPFHGEGEPPEHAVRARDAAAEAGLTVDFGPLGTTARGDAETVLDALPSIARAALDGGATRLTFQLSTGRTSSRPEPPPQTLARLIQDVEGQLGGRLSELDRPGKQRAVRLLEERGAFAMRKAVVTIAEALGVTRFTVYNYLNRDG
ncbi:MAG TPA: helix-turn-helix domain-containing protein [Amycolatopsis sp.]|uniref:helix-turn-helix domain-containing protein n=1 Tax=Amycolatopsis sp. TaxID=37632 RepID=UPI002B4A80E9|nr:helix-turn-helix domain-containing protein [Amycolatopsis sp.]HKS43974.1 helix-turn-helix domain-containing protein [Amycolatopsis sp.]